MKRPCLSAIAALALAALLALLPVTAMGFADEVADLSDGLEATASPATRTIMMYICGSDLEREYGYATSNLKQVLSASFSAHEDVRFIVMTGGANAWHMDASDLCQPDGTAVDGISTTYNQVWEAKGKDAGTHPGKMVLLDADGVTGDGDSAKKAEDELMTDPQTLKAFIDYCVGNYPASEYDLILWDHGGGPDGGFAMDDHTISGATMPVAQIADALANNAVARSGATFGFVDFDACLMGSVECALAFGDSARCYIASAETEPGNGQSYEGWLSAVGADPTIDAYELGKMIVDDFVRFYGTEGSEGYGQRATLSATNTQRLFQSGLIPALTQLSEELYRQASTKNAAGEFAFYDEMRSAAGSYAYGSGSKYDLGNFVSMLGVAAKEVTLDQAHGADLDITNAYTTLSKQIQAMLGDQSIIYAGATDNVVAGPEVCLDPTGTPVYRVLEPSGMYLAFPQGGSPGSLSAYAKRMQEIAAIPGMDNERKTLLSAYAKAASAYSLLEITGNVVTTVANKTDDPGIIDYDTVKAYLVERTDIGAGGAWSVWAQPLMSWLGGEESVKPWLEEVIAQQAAEVVAKRNVTVQDVRLPEGTGAKVTIANSSKRVIEGVDEKVVLTLKAAERYIANNPELQMLLSLSPEFKEFAIGQTSAEPSVGAAMFSDEGKGLAEDLVDWLNEPNSVWDFDPSQNRWFVIKDADGTAHAAFAGEGRTEGELMAVVAVEKDGEPQSDQVYILAFTDPAGTGSYTLSEVLPVVNGSIQRAILPQDLTEPLSLMCVQSIDMLGLKQYYVPISESCFVLTSQNASSIELDYVPVEEISDAEGVTTKYVVRDIYGAEIDITEQVENPVGELTGIELATVEPAVYNGQVQEPRVTLNGKLLQKDKDYVLVVYDDLKPTDVGEYRVFLAGMGDYASTTQATFVITPAPIGQASVTGIEDKTYTGGPIGQNLVLTFAGSMLGQGVDYTASYENNVAVGTATVTIQGLGNFGGTTTRTFKITADGGTRAAGSSASSTAKGSASKLPKTGDATPAAPVAATALLALSLLVPGLYGRRHRAL